MKPLPWGIYDPADKCWLGQENGPQLYEDRKINGQWFTGETLACAAATILNESYPRRFMAKVYNENADHLKDRITLLRTKGLSTDEKGGRERANIQRRCKSAATILRMRAWCS